MRVLVAPGPFSGALSAVEAAAAIRRGWLAQAPATTVVERAMSDGGTELLDVVHAARGGRLVSLTGHGPLGSPVPASLLHVAGAAGGTVYVDAGQVLGRQLTAAENALPAAERGTSRGLGELLLAALELGASRIVVGLGDAASHDAGRGVLEALTGDTSGSALAAARDRLARTDVVVAAGSTAPLLGLHGAGAMLAERPGIGPAEAQRLDTAIAGYVAELDRSAAALAVTRPPLAMASTAASPAHSHRPAGRVRPGGAEGSGAGGGVGYLLALLGARVLPGAPVVAGSIGLAGAVEDVDLVLTGRSVLDAPALDGGVLAAVSEAAMSLGLPVVVLAEEVHTSRREVARVGVSSTYEIGRPADGALAALESWSARVARTWARTA
ncbi:glycerate kinase [Georgenia sunbinii]|uniref:glycerate kinase n=1 Tax=Georgenia sunbinii TaxID=3117728 RepID=UPI002F26C800